MCSLKIFSVSIHAPAWGATKGRGTRKGKDERFNPRARMGRDVKTELLSGSFIVSIHAPAWGATDVCFNGKY